MRKIPLKNSFLKNKFITNSGKVKLLEAIYKLLIGKRLIWWLKMFNEDWSDIIAEHFNFFSFKVLIGFIDHCIETVVQIPCLYWLVHPLNHTHELLGYHVIDSQTEYGDSFVGISEALILVLDFID